MNPKTDFIFTTVTVKYICNKTGRLHGTAQTVEGSPVYIPKRLACNLKEGDVVEGKLKPSDDPRSKWVLVEIMVKGRKSISSGMKVYNPDYWNIVPRSNI